MRKLKKKEVIRHKNDIVSLYNSDNPKIYCSKIDASRILAKIGKYDINCFAYKWENNFKCVNGGVHC